MQTTQAKLTQELKRGKIDPVYLLYGQEDFIIERTSRQILDAAVDQESADFNLDVLYGNETDAAKIVNIAMSFPMMAERRAVLVRNINLLPTQGLDLLASYCQKPSPTTCLVLTAPKLDFRKSAFAKIRDHSTVLEAKPLYDNRVPDWIRGFLNEQGLQISNEALLLLQASVGNSLRRIASEVEKIRLNLGERQSIEVEDVEAVVGVSKKYNVFEFCDAVGKKDIKRSLQILDGMLQFGESPTGVLAMLHRHFTILAKIKELRAKRYAREQIAKELKINPYFIDSYSSQAGLYTREQLSMVFDELLEADFQLKTSYQRPDMVLQMLLFRLRRLNEAVAPQR